MKRLSQPPGRKEGLLGGSGVCWERAGSFSQKACVGSAQEKLLCLMAPSVVSVAPAPHVTCRSRMCAPLGRNPVGLGVVRIQSWDASMSHF